MSQKFFSLLIVSFKYHFFVFYFLLPVPSQENLQHITFCDCFFLTPVVIGFFSRLQYLVQLFSSFYLNRLIFFCMVFVEENKVSFLFFAREYAKKRTKVVGYSRFVKSSNSELWHFFLQINKIMRRIYLKIHLKCVYFLRGRMN